ncbi:MAG TPA: zinc-dependent alcohol dehydrogenase family protein [Gemmatimonadales bacterium]|nr:zinc-dependent alcohol dehydrogenase family protein [Gemmatimonadales bacterium]
MVLERAGSPLAFRQIERPQPGPGQVSLAVQACGVCRTDLHISAGELDRPKLPLVLGHEVVGRVDGHGPGANRWPVGTLVGVPWLGWTCGECRFCRTGRENLCLRAAFTGYDRDGGYAEQVVADERYCFAIPEGYDAVSAAPLLCAGLIGYRALTAAGGAARLGLYGFGAAAHIVAQVARHQGRQVFAFTRPGDDEGQRFARELGAAWAGGSDQPAPEPLDAAILFAPAGELVPAALRATDRGGRVICAGIHMSAIPSFPYEILWGERMVASVANLTRADGEAFFRLAAGVALEISTEVHPLDQANQALDRVRAGRVRGAAVLAG